MTFFYLWLLLPPLTLIKTQPNHIPWTTTNFLKAQSEIICSPSSAAVEIKQDPVRHLDRHRINSVCQLSSVTKTWDWFIRGAPIVWFIAEPFKAQFSMQSVIQKVYSLERHLIFFMFFKWFAKC